MRRWAEFMKSVNRSGVSRLTALIVAVGASLIAGVMVATGAVADHADPPDAGEEGYGVGALNTATWKICRNGIVSGMNAVDNTLPKLNVTDVSASVVSCASGNQNINVHSIEYWDTSVGGATACSGTFNSTNNRCSSMTVVLNATAIRATPEPAKQWNKTACHELGHVGGLGHRPINETCMASGVSPPVWTIYDAHDRGSMNLTY